ncbi:hypothetical protein TSUD_150550 [Trifolium subterraneum]|uniref:Uncharacterized protein n=1 Tax=Trifolium subterraneum TaxID=3900 RepID=A0A2Z6M0H9_TRISU|nr:hypothetical protein TSUD_150550 [Trifolium subterraneum]
MEEEEMVQEGDEGASKVRRSTWVNPYEGRPVAKEFLGGRPIRRYCMIMERRTLRDACITTFNEGNMCDIARHVYELDYTLLDIQTWIYELFDDIDGSLDDEFHKEYPQATKYEPAKGQLNQLTMRKMMNQLFPHDITWTLTR